MAANIERFLLLIICVSGLKTVYCYTVCPEGYCRHSNGCYLVVGLQVSWIDARSYCKTLGGRLLSITSEGIHSAVEGAMRRSIGDATPGKFWLDITDILNPRDWREMQSRTRLTYTNWDPLELFKNQTDNLNCVAMSEGSDYLWTTEDCSEKLNFVCYSSGSELNRYSYRHRHRNEPDEDSVIEC